MILIITEDFEISTNGTIQWLRRYGVPFIRINSDNCKIELVSLTLDDGAEDDLILKVNGQIVHMSQISAVWQRRGRINLNDDEDNSLDFLNKILPSGMFDYAVNNLRYEKGTLVGYINFFISQLPISLGNSNNSTLNKLGVLYKAKQVGLKISKAMVSSSKSEIQSFYDENKPIITKAILDNLFKTTENDNIVVYTEEIEREFIEKMPESVFYSFVQKKIEKKYELRIFYLKGKFYSMAIFSQRDKQTEIDFRKYNDNKPNRTVRYRLPKIIENQLDQLMKQLNLDTGSIDMIVNSNNDFIFLEVNPVGQYGMVSTPCNYNLDKEIADYLCSNIKEN